MKIAIISDSHDNVNRLRDAVSIANDKKCKFLIHLGDIISPFTAKVLKSFSGKIIAVFGNCDGDRIGLTKVFKSFKGEIHRSPFSFEINHKKFAIMHEPDFIEELILSKGFDYIFYGHMHHANLREKDNTIVLNPGETAGLSEKPTFYIADLLTNKFNKIKL